MKRATGGEIVQVEGGHILRSTGKKDRHSKVYTAKGPRDRRVRLSAHTAIQFYDVQDRLGYDRPSKAVDWLIKKAKNAIDKLDELPPWNPRIDAADGSSSGNNIVLEQQQQQNQQQEFQLQRQLEENNPSGWILPHHQQTLYSQQPQGAVFPQREPLQSNFSQLIHAWEERPPMNHVHHQAEISNRHFISDFQIPARIHGEHEEPSSASPNSHY
ncbi:uncharacterized protein LOC107773826 isoform X2 [Nicotiana tabacum]|uniref:Transcription factor TCP4-like isoform X2 n=1 Tax=Nicotiana tabacum TaxID=4097 RepID=A0A1S3Y990_TOBAC|nr:PREDICTED: transcription factor TCP4-like isoform X2 [Nicotiana tabacum]